MTVLLILGLIILIGLNGLFVAAEFALVRARESRLEQLRDDNVKGAALALEQHGQIDEYLAACQVGITMASIGIGFLGEPAIAELLEEPLGNVVSHGVAVTIALAVAYFLVTSLHITVGEQVPKLYSIAHAEGTARRLARLLGIFSRAFRPFIVALNHVSNFMLRRLNVDPEVMSEEASTSEDLKLLIARSQSGGTLDPGEAHMLQGVFHLHEQEARNVMTP